MFEVQAEALQLRLFLDDAVNKELIRLKDLLCSFLCSETLRAVIAHEDTIVDIYYGPNGCFAKMTRGTEINEDIVGPRHTMFLQ